MTSNSRGYYMPFSLFGFLFFHAGHVRALVRVDNDNWFFSAQIVDNVRRISGIQIFYCAVGFNR